MTKNYESTLEESEKSDLALINALSDSNLTVKSLIKKQQTCRKSTSGLAKHSSSILAQQQPQFKHISYLEERSKSRSVSNDSSINLNSDDHGASSSTASPGMGT